MISIKEFLNHVLDIFKKHKQNILYHCTKVKDAEWYIDAMSSNLEGLLKLQDKAPEVFEDKIDIDDIQKYNYYDLLDNVYPSVINRLNKLLHINEIYNYELLQFSNSLLAIDGFGETNVFSYWI